jgi:hypothetical protein
MIALKDEKLATQAAAALEFQYSYMGDAKNIETIQKVKPYLASDKKKYVRLNAVRLIAKLNRELAQNSATIGMCDLDPFIPMLESDDPDILNPVLDTFALCGTEREHRKAVQKYLERVQSEDLKKKATDAVEKIAEREEEGG